MHVYVITNLINNEQYIGAKKRHDPKYRGSGRLIREAIEKYGEENFYLEILVDNINDWEECLEIESQFIIGLNTLAPNGYNQKIVAWPLSAEMCRKGQKKTHEIIAKRRESDSNYDKKYRASRGEGGKIGGEIHGPKNLEKWKKEHRKEFLEQAKRIGKTTGKKNLERWTKECPGEFSESTSEAGKIGGKMTAHILFEIDGIFQQMTLGAIFGE